VEINQMSETEIEFELTVESGLEVDYKEIFEGEDIKRIEENLKKDEVLGWCRLLVAAKFSSFIEEAEYRYVSYISLEEFQKSQEYRHLQKEALGELKLKISALKKYFDVALTETLAQYDFTLEDFQWPETENEII
jgi:hypothetical protein